MPTNINKIWKTNRKFVHKLLSTYAQDVTGRRKGWMRRQAKLCIETMTVCCKMYDNRTNPILED